MKKLVIALAAVLVVVVAIVGWLVMKGKNDVASSLPLDVTMVARFDFPSLAVQYGMDGKDAGRIVKKLLWQSYDDVDGVDYLSSSYVFASQGYFGAVVPLSDSSKFKDFIQQARSCSFEQQRGISWAVVDYNMLMAVSDDRVMIMGPAVGQEQDALRNTIAACLKQKEKESGMQSALFHMLNSRQEPIALVTTYGALPEQAHVELLDNEIDLTSLYAAAGITLRKDRVDVFLSLSSNDPKINKFLDNLNEALQPTNGSLLVNAPTNPSLFIEAGINGDKLLAALRGIPSVRTKLLLANSIMDLDIMIRSIDGDVSFSLNDNVGLTQLQLKDARVLDNVSSWNDDISKAAGVYFEDRGGHKGSVRCKGHQFYYAADGKRVMLSRNDALVESTAHHDIDYNWAEAMDGQHVFASLNLQESFLKVYLKQFERVSVSSLDIRQWNVELVTKDGLELLDMIQ